MENNILATIFKCGNELKQFCYIKCMLGASQTLIFSFKDDHNDSIFAFIIMSCIIAHIIQTNTASLCQINSGRSWDMALNDSTLDVQLLGN